VNNKQLAGARKAMSGFAGVRPTKVGDTIVPKRAGASGAPVTVTDAMTAHEVEIALRRSCGTIGG